LPEFSNNYLTGVNTLYDNNQQSVIEFINKSKFIKIIEIEDYFKYYNYCFTTYIQNKYQNTNLIYHVSKAQLNHLMQLNYEEIQYILYLIQDTTYFKNRTFIDVHWEIFNGTHFLSPQNTNFKKITLSTLNDNYYTNFSNIKNYFQFYFNKITNSWLFSENKKPIGFYNPFHMNFPGTIEPHKIQKKYYFTEESLRLLPIHLLTKWNNHIMVDQLFVANIYEHSRSNNFWNFLSNSGNTFIERLFKYTEYGKYSPTTINFFSNNTEHIDTPYQKNFFLSHNPWWDSLTPSTQQKMYLLFQLKNEDLNHTFLILIYRFFENQPFASTEEILRLLPLVSVDEKEIPYMDEMAYMNSY